MRSTFWGVDSNKNIFLPKKYIRITSIFLHIESLSSKNFTFLRLMICLFCVYYIFVLTFSTQTSLFISSSKSIVLTVNAYFIIDTSIYAFFLLNIITLILLELYYISILFECVCIGRTTSKSVKKKNCSHYISVL